MICFIFSFSLLFVSMLVALLKQIPRKSSKSAIFGLRLQPKHIHYEWKLKKGRGRSRRRRRRQELYLTLKCARARLKGDRSTERDHMSHQMAALHKRVCTFPYQTRNHVSRACKPRPTRRVVSANERACTSGGCVVERERNMRPHVRTYS